MHILASEESDMRNHCWLTKNIPICDTALDQVVIESTAALPDIRDIQIWRYLRGIGVRMSEMQIRLLLLLEFVIPRPANSTFFNPPNINPPAARYSQLRNPRYTWIFSLTFAYVGLCGFDVGLCGFESVVDWLAGTLMKPRMSYNEAVFSRTKSERNCSK